MLKAKHIRNFILSVSIVLNIILLIILMVNWQGVKKEMRFILDLQKFSRDIEQATARDSIAGHFTAEKYPSESERIDAVREWIYTNSSHGSVFTAYSPSASINGLWRTHKTGQDTMTMSCGPRAMTMQVILQKMNIPCRLVSIFSDNFDNIRSHTCIEVYNKEAQSWELQDPDLNVFYADTVSGKRVPLARLMFGKTSDILPVRGDSSGWHLAQRDWMKYSIRDDMLEAAAYSNPKAGEKMVIIYKREAFDPDKTYPKNISFREFANKNYRNPIFVEQ